jgi:hypothetical protein
LKEPSRFKAALSDVLGIAEMLGKGGVHGDGTVVFAVIASGACQS